MKFFPVIAVLMVLSSCGSLDKECKDSTGNGVLGFTFDIPYSVNPAKDTLKVGDTLWIESTFGNQMYNRRNGKTYTLNDFDFKLSANVYDLKSNPLTPTPNYILVKENGTIDESQTDFMVDFVINYSFNNGNYRWKKGVVLTHQGLFLLGFYKGFGTKRLQDQNPPQRITECDDEYVSLNIKCLVPANSYLRQYAAEEGVKSWPDDHGSFAFYVKP